MATDAFTAAAASESAAYAAAPQAALPYDPSDPAGEMGAPAVYAMQPASTATDGAVVQSAPTDNGSANAQFFSSKGTFYRVAMAPYRTPPLYMLQGLTDFDLEDTQTDKQTKDDRAARNIDLADQYEKAHQTVLDAFPPAADRKTAVDWGVDTTFDTQQTAGADMTDQSAINDQQRAQGLADLNNAYDAVVQDNTNQDLQADQNTAATRQARNNVPVLMTGIRIGQRDIISEMPCLANVKVFYVFGQAFGQIQAAGEILLGPLGNEKSEGLKRLVDFFNKYRVSNYGKTIFAAVDGHHYQLYVTGLMVGEVNPELHIMPFGVVGTLIDPSNKGDALVNWAPKVNDIVTPNLSDTGALAQILNTAQKVDTAGNPVTPGTLATPTSLVWDPTIMDFAPVNPDSNWNGQTWDPATMDFVPAGSLLSAPSAAEDAGASSNFMLPSSAATSQAGAAAPQAVDLQTQLQQDRDPRHFAIQ